MIVLMDLISGHWNLSGISVSFEQTASIFCHVFLVRPVSYSGPGEVVVFGLYIHKQGFSFCLCILTISPAFTRRESL